MQRWMVLGLMVIAFGCGGRSVGQTVHHGPTALPPDEPPPPATTSTAGPSTTAPTPAPAPTAPAGPPAPLAARAGYVVDAGTAPVLAAGHGKAWMTKLATSSHAFIGLIKMAPGAAIPEHQDEADEYVYVLSGGGELTLDGKRHTIGPQSFICMPAGMTVSYQNGDAEMVALQVFAPPRPTAKYDGWQAVGR